MDNTNKKILKMLDKDARASYSDMANQLGLSVNTVRDRILSMEKKGIIKGYQPILSAPHNGFPAKVLALLRRDGAPQRVATDHFRHPFVQAAYTSPGRYGLIMELAGPNRAILQSFLKRHVYPLGYCAARLEPLEEAGEIAEFEARLSPIELSHDQMLAKAVVGS